MSEGQGGKLTTHVLDVRLGGPARDLEFTLFRIDGKERQPIGSGRTNNDGRAGRPLVEGDAFVPGTYELEFAVGAYQARHLEVGATGFYDLIPIRFLVSDSSAHYHVPLLLSPFGYSTYRGS